MPKEVIYGLSLPYGEDSPGRSVIEVSWSRHGSVQVATKCVHAADESDYHPPLEPIEVVPSFPAIEVAGEPVYTELQMAEGIRSGFYLDLDRAGINAVIRSLRRARDQAFGRDE